MPGCAALGAGGRAGSAAARLQFVCQPSRALQWPQPACAPAVAACACPQQTANRHSHPDCRRGRPEAGARGGFLPRVRTDTLARLPAAHVCGGACSPSRPPDHLHAQLQLQQHAVCQLSPLFVAALQPAPGDCGDTSPGAQLRWLPSHSVRGVQPPSWRQPCWVPGGRGANTHVSPGSRGDGKIDSLILCLLPTPAGCWWCSRAGPWGRVLRGRDCQGVIGLQHAHQKSLSLQECTAPSPLCSHERYAPPSHPSIRPPTHPA